MYHFLLHKTVVSSRFLSIVIAVELGQGDPHQVHPLLQLPSLHLPPHQASPYSHLTSRLKAAVLPSLTPPPAKAVFMCSTQSCTASLTFFPLSVSTLPPPIHPPSPPASPLIVPDGFCITGGQLYMILILTALLPGPH